MERYLIKRTVIKNDAEEITYYGDSVTMSSNEDPHKLYSLAYEEKDKALKTLSQAKIILSGKLELCTIEEN